jgi:hypothetical protein
LTADKNIKLIARRSRENRFFKQAVFWIIKINILNAMNEATSHLKYAKQDFGLKRYRIIFKMD